MSRSPNHARVLVALGACVVLTASGATVITQAQAAPAEERAAVKQLEAQLRPSGDPNGTGEAHFRLNRAKERVCAEAEWRRIGRPDGADIRRGSTGRAVVDLTGSVTGGRECARGVRKRLISRIVRHPQRFYFAVRNVRYPDGAIQGTLHR